MGVLFQQGDDIDHCLIPFLRDKGVDCVKDEIVRLHSLANLGRITTSAMWSTFGLPTLDIDYLSTIQLDHLALESAMLLSATFRLGLLTNNPSEWGNILRTRLDDLFEVAIVSGDHGVAKPEVEIFTAFLHATGARASDCTLIDDRKRNTIAAKALGFRTILYSRRNTDNSFADLQTTDWQAIRDFLETSERA